MWAKLYVISFSIFGNEHNMYTNCGGSGPHDSWVVTKLSISISPGSSMFARV